MGFMIVEDRDCKIMPRLKSLDQFLAVWNAVLTINCATNWNVYNLCVCTTFSYSLVSRVKGSLYNVQQSWGLCTHTFWHCHTCSDRASFVIHLLIKSAKQRQWEAQWPLSASLRLPHRLTPSDWVMLSSTRQVLHTWDLLSPLILQLSQRYHS